MRVVTQPTRDAYVALARSKSGKVFRKQILARGSFTHPALGDKPQVVDDAFMDSLIRNFRDEVCDIVQFPLVGDNNAHTESPTANAGEVIGLEKGPEGLFALIDVRDDKAAKMIEDKLLLGASAYYSTDYTDTSTGAHVGPTLLHVAGTNRPHITGLEPFTKFVAASADPNEETILLEAPVMPKSLEDILKALSDEDRKVAEAELAKLKPAAKTPEELAAEKKAADDKKAEDEKVAATAKTQTSTLEAVAKLLKDNGILPEGVDVAASASQPDALTNALKPVIERNVALSAQVATLMGDRAESEVNDLIRQGRILPAQKAKFVELCSKDHEMFLGLVPDKPITVPLSGGEKGVTGTASGEVPLRGELDVLSDTDAKAEIERYVAMSAPSKK